MLVVDDGSTDKTREVVADLADRHPRCACSRWAATWARPPRCAAASTQALLEGAEVVVMMDADGQDDPAELPLLLARLADGADLVTGARTVRNDRFVKRNTSKLYNAATARLSGAPGKDFNSGFKVMRADVARNASPMLYGELHRYLTVVAHWLGYRVAEVSVQHHERLHGKTKYGLARFWRGFVDLLTVRFLMTYESRPSHLFSGLGLASMAAGGLALAYLFVEKVSGAAIGGRPLLIAAVVLVLGGLQLVLFGLLAELQVYSRQRDAERERPPGPRRAPGGGQRRRPGRHHGARGARARSRPGVTTDEPIHVMRLRNFFDTGWYALDWDYAGAGPGGDGTNTYVYAPGDDAAAPRLVGALGCRGMARRRHDVPRVRRPPPRRRRHRAGRASRRSRRSGRVLLRSWRWGLVAAAVLAAIPMWTGHEMFNVKDVPVATGHTLVTLALILLRAATTRRAGRCGSPGPAVSSRVWC